MKGKTALDLAVHFNKEEAAAYLRDNLGALRAADLCARCGKPGATKRCGRCDAVRYCDRACQVAHWRAAEDGHRDACEACEQPSTCLNNNHHDH